MSYKNILWDFDGVILDSMKTRDFGFREIFKNFNSEDVDELIIYHRENGGLSRYVKIRYFFENILKRDIDQTEILNYASSFSEIMRIELKSKFNLILDSVDFIKKNSRNFNFHIVSGSDQEELRYLCKELELSKYFLSISGSPTPKNELVKALLLKNNYESFKTCLIGDSINDYEAAIKNNIDFFGYNNENLKGLQGTYINNFKNEDVFRV